MSRTRRQGILSPSTGQWFKHQWFSRQWHGALALPGLWLGNHCLLCGCAHRGELPLCPDCKLELPWLHHGCQQCALPLAAGDRFCGRCLQKPPSFKRCRAALVYANPIDRLIHQFKDRRRLLPGMLLSRLLREHLEHQLQADDRPDLITSVPLHWRRHWQRGFNQSTFLALQLSRNMDLPYLQLGKRHSATPKQQQLSRTQRLKNLKRAFSCETGKVRGRHIAIVDDVVTTQATAEAMSRALLKAGAKRVDIWAVARTPAPESEP